MKVFMKQVTEKQTFPHSQLGGKFMPLNVFVFYFVSEKRREGWEGKLWSMLTKFV